MSLLVRLHLLHQNRHRLENVALDIRDQLSPLLVIEPLPVDYLDWQHY